MLSAKRQEHRHDQRASREVVGGAHAYLVAGDVRRGEVEHRELPDGERLLGIDPAHGRGVVERLDVGDRLGEDCRERGAPRVAMDGHGNIRREHALAESAKNAGLSGLSGCFDDLERWMIGMRGEDERPLRRAC